MNEAKEASETKLKGYCIAVYDALSEVADSDGMWEGKLTEFVVETADVPRGWYTLVMTQLYGIGSIEKLQGGTRYQPSKVRLLNRPTELPWQKNLAQGLTRQTELARLSARVDDLRRQIGGLPIVEVLANFEERLAKLEMHVNSDTED